jgi:membrane protease YdiL (CAAX protease family)
MKAKYPIVYIFLLFIFLTPSIFFIEGIFQLILNKFYPHIKGNTDLINSSIYLIASMLGALVPIWIYRKFIDKETFFSMGFSIKNKGFDLFFGTSIGIILTSFGFISLIGMGNIEVLDLNFNIEQIIGSIILMILVAIHEEVIVRGYILNSLMGINNKYTALLLSSLLFAVLHLANPNISTISFVNLVLAGFLLGISYIHTKNLWFPIALHFSWNFMQGPILGFEVSGNKIQSVVLQQITGNEYITGGNFGFEGSLIATFIIAVCIIILDWFFKKKETMTQKIFLDLK